MIYEDIADIHSPLIPYLYTILLKIYPDALLLAKLLLVGLLSTIAVFIFLLGCRTVGPMSGLFGVLFFIALSPFYAFNNPWYETFLAPLYLLWILCYKPLAENRSVKVIFMCGILGGLAILIKQHALVAFAGFLGWHLYSEWSHKSRRQLIRETIIMAGAAILPLSIYCIYYYIQTGTLEALIYWIFWYALQSTYKTLAALSPQFFELKILVWSCTFLPFAIYCMIRAKRKNRPEWTIYGLSFVLLLTSSVTVYPRFSLQHLQACLPIIAFLSSLSVYFLLDFFKARRICQTIIFLLIIAYLTFSANRSYRPFINTSHEQVVVQYTELIPLSKEIRKVIGETECFYIFPDYEVLSNLYYLMQCLPPKSWIFHFPWFLTDASRDRILWMLETKQPKWIIFFPDTWDSEPYAPEIFAYIRHHYTNKASFPWRSEIILLRERMLNISQTDEKNHQ